MKILQINAVYRKLSTGRNVSELNTVFRQLGHEAVAAYSAGSVEDPQTEYLIGSTMGQKMHALLSRMTGLQGYYSRHATRKLLRYMDTWHPDVVLLNNLHANYIHLPMLLDYLARKDIATVAVLHDCWFYTGKCCHYTVRGCYRWQESCGNCPAKKLYNASWLFDRTPKMLRDKKKGFTSIPRLGVIAVSDWLLAQAKQAPVFENAVMLERIYNWIDTDTFVPVDTKQLRQELGLQEEKVVLCVAGAWDQTKGLDTVQYVAEHLQEQERMILVGNLPADIQLPERVIAVPKTDSVAKLVALYSLADVFLQPSPEETFGKVSAEALCCGTPVVCFNSTANPELVGPNCGCVVEPGDREGVLTAIRSLTAAGKQSFTDACRSFAAERFCLTENAAQYAAFCEKLTKECV